MCSSGVPVVDFSLWQQADQGGPLTSYHRQCAASLVEGLKDMGCVRLKNPGIQPDKVQEAFDCFGEFFNKPLEEKEKFVRPLNTLFGYHALGTVKINPEAKVTDREEAFNFLFKNMKEDDWPEALVPGVKQTMTQLSRSYWLLAKQVLQALAIGLSLEDNELFARAHSDADNTGVRYNMYIPVTSGSSDPVSEQKRMGEHKDGGSITLLVANGKKGLQFEQADGSWLDVTVGPDEALVICGELMQRWTADVLKAPRHRVVIPEGPERRTSRVSLVHFLIPDDDFIVECFDGSNKYPPISAKEFALDTYASHHIEK